MRRLIINADDLGFTRGVNRAIMEAHRHGPVTSATLMAGGAAFDEAVHLAQAAPALAVGCHIVLVGGAPLLPPADIPSLIAGDSASFRPRWGAFAAAALAGRLADDEIEAESTAQIRKLKQAGITVTHVDTHQHLHMFPQVLAPLLRAARACGVRAVRNPFEPLRFGLLRQEFRLWQRWVGVGILNRFAGSFRRTVRDAGILTTDGIFGVVATGSLNPPLFRHLIAGLPDGIWELVCHPGYDDTQLRTMPTRLWKSREQERQVLTSPETLELLTARAVQLVSYRDLLGQ